MSHSSTGVARDFFICAPAQMGVEPHMTIWARNPSLLHALLPEQTIGGSVASGMSTLTVSYPCLRLAHVIDQILRESQRKAEFPPAHADNSGVPVKVGDGCVVFDGLIGRGDLVPEGR
jgi:hypothetical protein